MRPKYCRSNSCSSFTSWLSVQHAWRYSACGTRFSTSGRNKTYASFKELPEATGSSVAHAISISRSASAQALTSSFEYMSSNARLHARAAATHASLCKPLLGGIGRFSAFICIRQDTRARYPPDPSNTGLRDLRNTDRPDLNRQARQDHRTRDLLAPSKQDRLDHRKRDHRGLHTEDRRDPHNMDLPD